jgi:hypothetical protein
MERARLGIATAVAVAALAVSPGCDGGSGTDADVVPDGCSGCIDATGACRPGNGDDACGPRGGACVACSGGEGCVAGACVEPPACGPGSCDGCCEAGACIAAASVGDAACGRGGGACNRCPAGATCASGECVLPCSDQCRGCCDGAGQCRTGDAPAECGIGGGSCEACADGEICSGGTCVGCCSGDTCLAGDSSTACGTGGVACEDCGTHRTCGDGGCVVSETSRWDVVAIDGVVPEQDGAGEAWDPWGGLPDPFVRMSVTDDPETIVRDSVVVSDTTTPSWLDPVLTDVPARALEPGIQISVFDDDYDYNDPMGQCLVEVTEEHFDDTPFEVRCEDGVGWTISLRIRPH